MGTFLPTFFDSGGVGRVPGYKNVPIIPFSSSDIGHLTINFHVLSIVIVVALMATALDPPNVPYLWATSKVASVIDPYMIRSLNVESIAAGHFDSFAEIHVNRSSIRQRIRHHLIKCNGSATANVKEVNIEVEKQVRHRYRVLQRAVMRKIGEAVPA